MASPENQKIVGTVFLGVLMDRSLCNAYVVYNKLETESCNLLSFIRSVAQSLITLAKPSQVGRPISTPCNQVTAKKRQKSNFSVRASIRTENVGIHWVVYDKKRGRCEVCSRKKIQARPYFKCFACKVHLCINNKKTVSVNVMDKKYFLGL